MVFLSALVYNEDISFRTIADLSRFDSERSAKCEFLRPLLCSKRFFLLFPALLGESFETESLFSPESLRLSNNSGKCSRCHIIEFLTAE